MKKLYRSNLIFTCTLLLISITFWGGIFALPVLGIVQIVISIIIYRNRKTLNKEIKTLFQAYIITTIILAIIFKLLNEFEIIETLTLMFIWMFISAILALFHLFITYKINRL